VLEFADLSAGDIKLSDRRGQGRKAADIRRSGFGATHAFSRRPLSHPFRRFVGPIVKGSEGVESGGA